MSSKSKMKARRSRKRTQGYRKCRKELRVAQLRDGWLVRLWKKVFF